MFLALNIINRTVGLVVVAGNLEPNRVPGSFCGQVCVQLPEFLRHELADFPLTLNDQAHGNRLNPASRQAPGNLGPEQRRNHVTHNAIQEPARLLGIYPVVIQLTGVLERFLDGPLGNFVEHHAAILFRLAANGLLKVPGDGFPFPVQIRCQIDVVGVLGQALELADDLFLTGQDLVTGAPVVIGIYPHAGNQLFTGLTLLVLGFFVRAHLAGGSSLPGALFRV